MTGCASSRGAFTQRAPISIHTTPAIVASGGAKENYTWGKKDLAMKIEREVKRREGKIHGDLRKSPNDGELATDT